MRLAGTFRVSRGTWAIARALRVGLSSSEASSLSVYVMFLRLRFGYRDTLVRLACASVVGKALFSEAFFVLACTRVERRTGDFPEVLESGSKSHDVRFTLRPLEPHELDFAGALRAAGLAFINSGIGG